MTWQETVQSETHPGLELLEKFANGRLDDAQSGKIEEHLEECDSCCLALAKISSDSDRFVEAVVNAAEASSADSTSLTGDQSESFRCPSMIGRFRIIRQIGRGGFGVVLLAHDEHLHRDVALKIPREGIYLTPELRQRFLREARAAAALDHPHIVPVYEAGEENGWCYLASAYCRGPNLADWLKSQSAPVNTEIAVKIVYDIAAAVEHAHERGVLHRDIKPANILLDPIENGQDNVEKNGNGGEFTPRISDFGLAKLAGAEQDATNSNVLMGTVNYMAPEQATGRNGTVGPLADVYGLGAVFYELLTGRSPILGETDLETLQQIHTQDPVAPRRLRPSIHVDLETICLKALEKKPQHRYSSAAEFSNDLRLWLGGFPITARPISRAARCGRWIQRNPFISAISCLLMTAIVMIAVGSLVYASRLESEVLRRQNAELQARQQLMESYLLTVKMGRLSRRSGQRFDGLATLQKAVDMNQDSDLYMDKVRMRSEAIGILALADVKLQSSYPTRFLQAWIKRVDFSRDLTRAVWCETNELVVFDLTRGSVLNRLRSRMLPHRILISPDGDHLVCISKSDQKSAVQIFDLDSSLDPVLIRDFGTPVDAAISPDGQLLAVVDQQAHVTLLDFATHKLIREFDIVQDSSGCAFSPDSTKIIVFGDSQVELFDIEGVALGQWDTPGPQQLRVAAISPDGRFLAAGGSSHDVLLWNLESGKEPTVLSDHQSWITSLIFAPDSRVLISSSSDGISRIWEAMSERELVSFRGQCVQLAPDGTRLGGLIGNKIVQWQIETGKECRMTPVYDEAYLAKLDPSGQLLATISTQGVSIWAVPDWQYEAHIDCEAFFAEFFVSDRGLELLYSNIDGLFRATVTHDRESKKIEIGVPDRIAHPPGCDCIQSGMISNTLTAAMIADGSKIVILDLASSDPVDVIEFENLSGVSISPDGKLVTAFTKHSRGVTVYELETGSEWTCVDDQPVTGVMFDPSGNHLLVDTHDELLLVNPRSWKSEGKIPWETSSDAVRWAADWTFANDGNLVAVRHEPYKVSLIDLQSRSLIGHVPVEYPYPWIQLTPKGNWLICTDKRMKTQIWNLVAIRQALRKIGLDWQTE